MCLLLLGCINWSNSQPLVTQGSSIPPNTPQPDQSHSTQTATPTFEIHEWGVMVGCANSPYILTSRPEKVVLVKQPVIFIHSTSPFDLELNITFLQGKPSFTYPSAKSFSNLLTWDVHVEKSKSSRITKSYNSQQFVDFSQILPVLNQSDGNLLTVGGQKTTFLYYEGELPFKNQVQASTDNIDEGSCVDCAQSQVVVLENKGKYAVKDVYVVFADEGKNVFSPTIKYAYLPELDPGDKVKVSISNASVNQLRGKIIDKMLNIGFTMQESNLFTDLWAQPFFYKENRAGWINLIYRLPDSVYENYVHMSTDKAPKKVVRTIFVLVHVKE